MDADLKPCPLRVIEKWNKRAGKTCNDVSKCEFFKCSECGHSVEIEYGDSKLYDSDGTIVAGFDFCPFCGAEVQ